MPREGSTVLYAKNRNDQGSTGRGSNDFWTEAVCRIGAQPHSCKIQGGCRPDNRPHIRRVPNLISIDAKDSCLPQYLRFIPLRLPDDGKHPLGSLYVREFLEDGIWAHELVSSQLATDSSFRRRLTLEIMRRQRKTEDSVRVTPNQIEAAFGAFHYEGAFLCPGFLVVEEKS